VGRAYVGRLSAMSVMPGRRKADSPQAGFFLVTRVHLTAVLRRLSPRSGVPRRTSSSIGKARTAPLTLGDSQRPDRRSFGDAAGDALTGHMVAP
jgi:hypothetical protein